MIYFFWFRDKCFGRSCWWRGFKSHIAVNQTNLKTVWESVCGWHWQSFLANCFIKGNERTSSLMKLHVQYYKINVVFLKYIFFNNVSVVMIRIDVLFMKSVFFSPMYNFTPTKWNICSSATFFTSYFFLSS